MRPTRLVRLYSLLLLLFVLKGSPARVDRDPGGASETAMLRLATLACGLAALLACGSGGPGEPGVPRSVLLVTIDTLRADHVGAYGATGVRTPTLDRLAASGVRVETAVAPTPLTLPSHASLLTGLYPPRHGLRHNALYRLPERVPTLAERFQEAGWTTGAVVGSVVLASRYGLDRGFDHYDDGASSGQATPTGFAERPAEAVTDAALEWLEPRRDERFFLWVHYYDPHREYRAPERFRRALPERPYDAEVAYADEQLGRLLDALEGEGRPSRTLVVATSDHGESLGEHGERSHGYTLYDATQRVPLLFAGPGAPPGAVSGALASSVDVAPTLLALCDLPPLEGVDGRDLAGRWRSDAGGGERAVYAETRAPQIEFGWAPLYAARSARHLYVRAPEPELYDVEADPRQEHNLLEDAERSPPSAVRSRLAGRIAAVREEAVDSARTELDRATREKIRALGYALPEGEVAPSGLDPKRGLEVLPLLDEALAAYAEDRDARAIRLFERVLDTAPGSARAHAYLGFAHLHAGRAEKALEHAEAAVRLNPRHDYYRAMRAETLLSLGRRRKAEEEYRRLAELRPESPWAHLARVWTALREGDLQRADRHARKTLEAAPGSFPVRTKLAHLLLRYGHERRALLAFRRALGVRPESGYAHMRLAILHARAGELDRSREHRRRAGALAHDARLGRELVVALAKGAGPAAAKALLRELLSRHPEDRALRRLRERLEALAEGDEGARSGTASTSGSAFPSSASR